MNTRRNIVAVIDAMVAVAPDLEDVLALPRKRAMYLAPEQQDRDFWNAVGELLVAWSHGTASRETVDRVGLIWSDRVEVPGARS